MATANAPGKRALVVKQAVHRIGKLLSRKELFPYAQVYFFQLSLYLATARFPSSTPLTICHIEAPQGGPSGWFILFQSGCGN
jgi:hypothetical protein